MADNNTKTENALATQTSTAYNIVQCAILSAWPANTKAAKYTYGDNGKAYGAFNSYFDKAFPNHSEWKNNKTKIGASCDVYAATVLRASGYDTKMPSGLAKQITYLRKSNKYTEHSYECVPSSTNAVQVGDIVLYQRQNGDGHIMIIVAVNGKKAIAEASYPKGYFGHINTSLSKITNPGSGEKKKRWTRVYRPGGGIATSAKNIINEETGEVEGTIKTYNGEVTVYNVEGPYTPGISYGGGLESLYNSYDFVHVFDEDVNATIRDLIENTNGYITDGEEKFSRVSNNVLSDVLLTSSWNVNNYITDKAKRYYKSGTTSELISSESVVQAPFVTVDFNGTKIGGVNNAGDSYPNYIESVSSNKINGKINSHLITIKYQVRPNEDANFIDKLISQCGYTNPISILYGDANSPGATYYEQEAVITDVKYSEDIASSTIVYKISTLSKGGLSGGYLNNYPSITTKPSSAIFKLFYESGEVSKYLQEAFPGMQDRTLVASKGIIPTNDKEVHLANRLNVDPIQYLSYLVSCMNNEASDKSSYFLSFNDDINSGLGGAFIKVTEVVSHNSDEQYRISDMVANSEFYEIDIGYTSDNFITNFSINSDSYWPLVYEYNDAIPSYKYGIDDDGNILVRKSNRLLSDNAYVEDSLINSNWWRDVTEFPISAKLTLKGILKPMMLMSYIKINAQFFGQRDLVSGIYVVTEQNDSISGNGYFTELTLLRVAGDNIK